MQSTTPSTESKSLQTILSNIGIIVGTLYSLGFFIASIHLAQINMRADKLLSAQYIIVGILFTTHILIGIAIGIYLIGRFKSQNVKSRIKQIMYSLLIIPFAFFSLYILYFLLFGNVLLPFTLLRLVIISSILVVLIGVGGAIVTELRPLTISLNDYPQITLSRLFIGAGFLIILSLYSTMIYPTIPDTFGGGQMKIISFQFKDKLPVHLHDYLYKHYDTVSNYTQYNLVNETEREYYVILDRHPSKIMAIPKESLISSIIESDTDQSFILQSNIVNFADTIFHK